MKRDIIPAVVALVLGASGMLTSCGDAAKPEAKPAHSSAPSVGQQYGETLHGAITQAQDARHTLEQSSRQALGHTSDPVE